MSNRYLLTQIGHILILGPLLLYIGISKPPQNWLYQILMILGIIAISTFLMKLILAWSTLFWTMWHILFISIILIWVGVKKDKSPSFLFNLLIIIGSAAIGYNLIKLLKRFIK
jgi:hypothetical protein